MDAPAAPTAPGTGMFMRTIQGGVIRSLFDTLKDIVHDVNLRFDATGIKLTTLDKSKCALVYLKLDAESFEEYRCDGVFDLGINVTNTFKLIRAAGGRDSVAFSYDVANPHEMDIIVQNFERNSSTTFALKLMDVDDDNIELDDVDFDSIITMPSAYFQRLCRDMSDIADTMRIKSEGGSVTLSCDGQFASQRTLIGQSDKDGASVANGMSMTNDEACEGAYQLKFLTTFCKSSSLCPTVEIYLHRDHMALRYSVASLGSVKFCLVRLSEE